MQAVKKGGLGIGRKAEGSIWLTIPGASCLSTTYSSKAAGAADKKCAMHRLRQQSLSGNARGARVVTPYCSIEMTILPK
jgi:hypothetical protein